jgi:hypothetical protein
VPALALHPSVAVFEPSSQAIHTIDLKFTIDIRSNLWYPAACYLDKASLIRSFALALTPNLSIVCRLLFTLSLEGQSLASLFHAALLCFQ